VEAIFSERVQPVTATNTANYALTSTD
jgi:hypothetical protein